MKLTLAVVEAPTVKKTLVVVSAKCIMTPVDMNVLTENLAVTHQHQFT